MMQKIKEKINGLEGDWAAAELTLKSNLEQEKDSMSLCEKYNIRGFKPRHNALSPIVHSY